MKAIGMISSYDQTKLVVIYKEKSGSFTVADRDKAGREHNFHVCYDVFEAVHEAESRVK